MITRNDIVDCARQYLGVPFRKGGRSKFSLDCVGLLIMVHRDLGLPIRDETTYTFNPFKNSVIIDEYLFGQTDPASFTAPKHGQIGVMKDSAFPMHFGIVARDGDYTTFINANTKARRVVEQPWTDWKSSVVGLREFRGIAL